MSFSSEIKEKLCREHGRCVNCKNACLSGVFEFAGRKNGDEIRFVTENEYVADYIADAVYDSKSVRYVKGVRDCRFFLDSSGSIMKEITAWEKSASSCCFRSYVRGAFLGGGSVTDPKSAYHLEFVTRYDEQAKKLAGILNDSGIAAKITRRKGLYTVYIKECEAIADALGLMGAHGGGLELYSVQVEKELRNRINRRVNCETANTDKTARAASKQIAAIRKIKDAGKWESLPETLKEMGELRAENPDVSLKELGDMTNPPIGKSGVNHRLDRLIKFADSL